MADIFHEVDEEVRRERLKQLWDQYGLYFLVLAVLVVAGIGGWRAYEYYQNQRAAQFGSQFEAAAALADAVAVVPALFHLELANTLVVGERRGRSTEAQASAFLARMAALPIVEDDQTMKRAWSETIALARSHNLSAYDAAYLELAARESLALATLDDSLAAAAQAVGLARFNP